MTWHTFSGQPFLRTAAADALVSRRSQNENDSAPTREFVDGRGQVGRERAVDVRLRNVVVPPFVAFIFLPRSLVEKEIGTLSVLKSISMT